MFGRNLFGFYVSLKFLLSNVEWPLNDAIYLSIYTTKRPQKTDIVRI